MKTFKNILTSLMAVVFIVGLTFSFNACSEQSPFQPSENGVNGTLAKRNNGGGGDPGGNDPAAYPQFISNTITFNSSQNQYNGGNMQVPGGTSFSLTGGALTPPPDSTVGTDITLTLQAEKKKYKGKDVLLFTFGPHGSAFNPRAEVTFDWNDLGIEMANLYYLDEDGNLVIQAPDQIEIQNKKMTIYLDHFSRYAIGME